MKRIRVLIVEDSLVFRECLVRGLNSDPEIEVVATARDPYEARDAIIQYSPDVMTLDVNLPRMNGIEFLRKLMPQRPVPTIVVSSLSSSVFDALSSGAVDFVGKPQLTDREQLNAFIKDELAVKIKMAPTAKLRKFRNPNVPVSAPNVASALPKTNKIVAIGASTGGTEAIFSILKEFRPDIPGIIIVQHMPAKFTEMYAQRLNNQCSIEVKEAETGDIVRQGLALVAPGGEKHMRLVKTGGVYKVECREGPLAGGHRPSVNVLFESVADVAGASAIGIILTGMGGDGAQGLLKMRNAGAETIGQNEETCVVYGMPKVAYDIGAVKYQMSLTDIPRKVYTLLNNK